MSEQEEQGKQGQPEEIGFDADAKAAKRTEREVIVGGRVFKPKKRSVKVMRRIGKITKEAKSMSDGIDLKNPDPELQMELLVPMCKQIGVMLYDTSDSPISGVDAQEDGSVALLEFLEEELDYEDATELMAFLGIGPNQEERNAIADFVQQVEQAADALEAEEAGRPARPEDEVPEGGGDGQAVPPPADPPAGEPLPPEPQPTPGTEPSQPPEPTDASSTPTPVVQTASSGSGNEAVGVGSTPNSPTSG